MRDDPFPGYSSGPLQYHNPDLRRQAYQRHLLLVGFTDRQLGKLVARLRATGLYDKSLLVITSDHGISFRTADWRNVNRRNVRDIAPIPLFIKAPGQYRGRIDERWIRTVDILPSIASMLGARIPWRHDGRPATAAVTRRRQGVRIVRRRFDGYVTVPAAQFLRERDQALAWKTALFGHGRDRPGLYGIGPHRELIGRPVADLVVGPRRRLSVRLDAVESWRAVDRGSGFVPGMVSGRIGGGQAGARRNIAVAVNGTVRAVFRSYHFPRVSGERFTAIVPDGAVRDGTNDVEVYAVGGREDRLKLTPLGGTD